jgi:uncharacterized membrane protein SpoIIM required for sporulation
MNESAFVERREPGWKRLVWLSDRADSGLGGLTPAEFREFVTLYRQASSDLAIVQTRSSNRELETFLNETVARAYSILYRSKRISFGEACRTILATVAQTGRRCGRFVGASALMFFGSILFSYFVLSAVPSSRSVFIPEGMEENTKAWKEGLPARSGEQSMMATGMYASNNPMAAIMTSSVAAASFGIGTVYVLYENGTMVGALAHEMAGVGKLPFLIVSLLPHGVTELSGLVFSGAAGFCLAWAVIAPGRYSRAESLRRAGKDAIVLLGTSVVMMFMAAPVEGFFSFNPNIPVALKVAFAGTMAMAWAAFWLGYGRTDGQPFGIRPGLALAGQREDHN